MIFVLDAGSVAAVAAAVAVSVLDVVDLIIVIALLRTQHADMKWSKKTSQQKNYANYVLVLLNCNLKNVVVI